MNDEMINGIEYDDIERISHHYIARINYIAHIPKCCMYCGNFDLINNVVSIKIGLTKNKLKSQYSLLCFNCETLMVITHDEEYHILIKPILGNKIFLRQHTLQPVNDSLRTIEFSSGIPTWGFFEYGVKLIHSVLFDFLIHGAI